MPITVLKNNVPWGPFTRGQIQEGIARGDFSLKYLAHGPGLKEWLPLGEVLDHFDKVASLPPVPGAPDLARPIILGDSPPPSPFAAPHLSPPAPVEIARASVKPPPIPTEPPVITSPPVPTETKIPASAPKTPANDLPESSARPAPFFRRFIAFAIDCAVLFVPIALVFGLSFLAIWIQSTIKHDDPESLRQDRLLLQRDFLNLLGFVAIGGAWLYAAFLECSHWQGTVGKRWLGLKVTDPQGERLSFFRATGRHAAKFLSALPLFLGFTMALFSRRGLALHDRLASTRVIKK